MGVVVWPMVELEADDGLASAARIANEDERVEQVCIWANDKDLAQCVIGNRVVQVDRRAKEIRDAAGGAREVRGRAGADSRPAGAGGGRAGRLPRDRRHRQGHGRPAAQPARADRGVSRQRPGSGPRAGACCSSASPRSEPTRRCFTTSMISGGGDPRRVSRPGRRAWEINGCRTEWWRRPARPARAPSDAARCEAWSLQAECPLPAG